MFLSSLFPSSSPASRPINEPPHHRPATALCPGRLCARLLTLEQAGGRAHNAIRALRKQQSTGVSRALARGAGVQVGGGTNGRTRSRASEVCAHKREIKHERGGEILLFLFFLDRVLVAAKISQNRAHEHDGLLDLPPPPPLPINRLRRPRASAHKRAI